VGARKGARLGQSCAGDASDAAPRGSQACSWPPMCGTRCVPAAVPRQNPPSAICYRARALAQRWCATPGLSATRRALEAWACLVVPLLTSAAIGAVVPRHNCPLLGRPSLRSIHACSLVAQVWPVRDRHKRRSHASASCPIAAAARCSDWPAGTSSAASSSAKPVVVARRSHCELAPNMRSCNSRPGPLTPPRRPPTAPTPRLGPNLAISGEKPTRYASDFGRYRRPKSG
jgi:hypothetical protein